MLCSETDGQMKAVHVAMPRDLALDISYLLNAIKQAGGNGRILLTVSGGDVIDTELTVKRPRKRTA